MAKYIFIILVLLCVGCTKKTHDTVYIHTTDTVYQSKTLIDYLVERDTVNTYTRGDTVFQDVVKWRWRDRVKTDTVYVAHRDTLWRDREVIIEKPVERKLSWWEKARLNSWWWIVGCWLVLLLVVVFNQQVGNLLKKIFRK